jgi:hypothetical protein
VKNLTVGLEPALLGPDFKISEELQERGIIDFLAVGHENPVEGRENPGFPIDQGAIAVESQDSEATEVEHGVQRLTRGLRRGLPWFAAPWLCSFRRLQLPLVAGCRAVQNWRLCSSRLPDFERLRQLKGDSGFGR